LFTAGQKHGTQLLRFSTPTFHIQAIIFVFNSYKECCVFMQLLNFSTYCFCVIEVPEMPEPESTGNLKHFITSYVWIKQKLPLSAFLNFRCHQLFRQ